uniref:Uncharacterized protein n=1 Tax=Amorphochlora amoebiformis TaxID=1561963 RepID=A0A0H5BIL3_9EUKA|nr:hypothetical protein [Amorphochlora amoebiformis]|mmetsp:Transcript_29234/g.46629  ORF Transcript_29234/g.46629 Transcript_29234/m.46629 type:complete len:108 (+) Transcript_29234:4053-4376(+)
MKVMILIKIRPEALKLNLLDITDLIQFIKKKHSQEHKKTKVKKYKNSFIKLVYKCTSEKHIPGMMEYGMEISTYIYQKYKKIFIVKTYDYERGDEKSKITIVINIKK